MGLREAEAAASRTTDVIPSRAVSAALPLVANAAKAVYVSQGIGDSEGLVLAGSASQGDAASGGVVDVGDCSSRR